MEFMMAKKVRHSGKTHSRVDAKKIAEALGAEVITDLKERKRFEEKYGIPLSLGNKAVETCGNCKHWDTDGFGLREDWGSQKAAQVGKCQLVARNCFPYSADKMIALIYTEYAGSPGSELIAVITRREFGCNQFKSEDKNPA